MANKIEARYREGEVEDFCVVYDDQPNEIVEKISRALERHGFSIVDDGGSHEGFELYQIVSIGEPGLSTSTNANASEPFTERTRVAFESLRAEVRRLVLAEHPPHFPGKCSTLIDAAASLSRAIAADIVESMPPGVLRE